MPGWEPVNVNGFGDRDNGGVWALGTFNGALYAGTLNYAGGTEVYRLSSGSWEQVVSGGFGDSMNVAVDWFADFDGTLYAGTWNESPGGQIWRSPTGDSGSWEQVVSDGFGDTTNGEIMVLAAFDGYLYGGTWSYDLEAHGAEIWRSTTGDTGSWARVVSDGFDGGSSNQAILSMEAFNGYLYAATSNSDTGGEIWRTSDGTTWVQVNTDGFGDAGNSSVASLGVLDGTLYAGTWNSDTGGEIWRTTDGTTWEQVMSGGFGNTDNFDVASLVAMDGTLYAIADNANTGPEVWRSSTGDSGSWQKVIDTGFGSGRAAAVRWDNVAAVLEDSLYVGTFTQGNGGGRVWHKALTARFTASPTSGVAPLTVAFTNLSTGDYDTSLWDFGDGVTDTIESPMHSYTTGGVYTVTLEVSGPMGSDTEVKGRYITVQHGVYLPLVVRDN